MKNHEIFEENVRQQGSVNILTRTYRQNPPKNPLWYSQKFPSNLTEIIYYKSGWGDEWRRVTEELGRHFEMSEQTGRSSGTFMPFFTLKDSEGGLYSFALMYSGNWKVAIERNPEETQLQIGFDDDFFFFTEAATEAADFTCPSVAFVKSDAGDNNEDALRQIWQNFSDEWMLKNALQAKRPVVWNHWWAYEDKQINEEIFLANAEVAKKIGVELCLLDAGWFGADADWYEVRGDWTLENTAEFPSGIAALSERIHALGLKFGLWIEIEAAGRESQLARHHPEFLAVKNDVSQHYLCFGNPAVVDWALETLSNLIEKNHCDWVKFDFNLEPQSCTSEQHGHGRGDGLYAHYQGLYRFFDELQARFPEVVFENCSSGGLRTDFGLLQHFHYNFLSDADYPQHKLRCFQSASDFISPRRIYHFVPSTTIANAEGNRPFPSTDFSRLSDEKIRQAMQIGGLTTMGISHPLINYDARVLRIMQEEIAKFKRKAAFSDAL